MAAALPAAASAAFSASYNLSATSIAAAVHPDLIATADFPGAPEPDPKSLTFTLPVGLVIAPGAVASPCSLTDAASGNCAAAAKIGTVTATATGSVTAVGDLFMTAPPAAGDVAGLAIKMVVSGGAGNFIAQGSFDLNLNGSSQQNQRIKFTNIPDTTSSAAAIHLTELRLILLAATGGTAHPLVTNPSTCPTTSQNAIVNATAYDGSAAQAMSAYPVTNCSSLAFAPAFDMTFNNPTAGGVTNTTLTLDVPAGNSSNKVVSFGLPSDIAINWPSLAPVADRCPASAFPSATSPFDTSSCPPWAKIGTVTLTTPLSSSPLTGDLWIVDKFPMPWFAADIHNPSGTIIRFRVAIDVKQVDPLCDPVTNPGPDGSCASRYLLSARMPDVPLSELRIATGATGRIPDTVFSFVTSPCSSPDTETFAAAPYAGTPNVTTTDQIGISGCAGVDPPDTTITSVPPNPTNQTSPQISFGSSDAGATFQCMVVPRAYVPCTSPYTVAPPLQPDGQYTFRVRAVNAAGPDPSPAQTTLNVDTTAPVAPTISSPADGATVTAIPAQVTFSGEPGGSFKCSVDGGAFATCSSPFNSSIAVNGTHTVAVEQIDAAGNISAATSRSFIVSVSITVSGGVVPTSTQAAAHPDLVVTTDFPGMPDPKSLTLTLPVGLLLAPGAVATPCLLTDAAAGNCAASTKIGSVSATATGGVTATGDIFMTAPPTSTDVAGIAIKMNVSGGAGSVVAQGGFDLNSYADDYYDKSHWNQYLRFNNLPNTTTTSAPIHLTELRMVFSGATGGTAHPLVTNPSACPATSQNATISTVAYDGSAAQTVNAYPVTGCASVPFAASFGMTFTNPTAGAVTNSTFILDIPAGSGDAKVVIFGMPPDVGLNYSAWGSAVDMCPSSSTPTTNKFNPSTCPSPPGNPGHPELGSARVGTISLDTPLLSHPLVGNLYLINKSPIDWFGIDINPSIAGNPQGVTIRTAGPLAWPQLDPTCDPVTNPDPPGGCQTRTELSMSLPDIPVNELRIMTGAAGRVDSTGHALSDEMWLFATPICPYTWLGALDTSKYAASSYSGRPTVNATSAPFTLNGC